jgi:glycerophosphoryl diester phosphodiesterase
MKFGRQMHGFHPAICDNTKSFVGRLGRRVIVMKILAHRGWWLAPHERNTLSAFDKAFASGHGVELDVRDLNGELVISHDPATTGALPFARVLECYAAKGAPGLLAINIKADGLCPALVPMLDQYGVTRRSFVFDASVPDLRPYLDSDVPVFTRYSEVELYPSFYDRCEGVWVDSFTEKPASIERAIDDLRRGKYVAMVSPELHKRPHEAVWAAWSAALRQAAKSGLPFERLMICTDLPDAAEQSFAWMVEEEVT